MKWKQAGRSLQTKQGNDLICLVHENIPFDYLHVLFYPLRDEDKSKFEEYIKVKEYPGLTQYYDFLCEHNGCLLFSGSIVLFGYTEIHHFNYLEEPSSIKRLNESDEFCKQNEQFIYIGNICHLDGDNINIYLSHNGQIFWRHKNKDIKEFATLNDMLKHIIDYYNPHYNQNGENKKYNLDCNDVYENIQLYQ